MSVNVKENGLLKNVEKKFRPKTFATFAAEHFKLGPSDKKLYLSDEVSAKISHVGESADWLKSKNLMDASLLADSRIMTNIQRVYDLLPNKTYTLSTDLPKTWNGDGAYIVMGVTRTWSGSEECYDGHPSTFTTGEDGKAYLLYRYDSNIKSFKNYKIQLQEGTEPLPYQPYNKSNVELTEEIANLDNMAQRGMVEYGYWWNGTDGYDSTRFFRSKIKYSLIGKIIFENNTDYPLAISRVSDYITIREVAPHQTYTYNAEEPIVWYLSYGEVLTETDIEYFLSQIRVYAPTGTIDNAVTKEISKSEPVKKDFQNSEQINQLVQFLVSEVSNKDSGIYNYSGSWNSHLGGYTAIVNKSAYSTISGTIYAADGTGANFVRYDNATKIASFTMI